MMLNERLILTDCDGVILNWNAGFNKWMEFHGYKMLENSSHYYKISKRYGIEKDLSEKLVKEFNNSSDIGFLSAYRDSLYYMDLLYRKHGYKFGVITSLSNYPASQKLRKGNLDKLFGSDMFEFLICLDTGADKDQALAKFQDSECFWIEDSVKNAEVGANMGLRSLLMEHPYNVAEELADGVTRVKNWSEIYSIIVGY